MAVRKRIATKVINTFLDLNYNYVHRIIFKFSSIKLKLNMMEPINAKYQFIFVFIVNVRSCRITSHMYWSCSRLSFLIIYLIKLRTEKAFEDSSSRSTYKPEDL